MAEQLLGFCVYAFAQRNVLLYMSGRFENLADATAFARTLADGAMHRGLMVKVISIDSAHVEASLNISALGAN